MPDSDWNKGIFPTNGPLPNRGTEKNEYGFVEEIIQK